MPRPPTFPPLDDATALLGSPWRELETGEVAIVVGVPKDGGAGEIRLGGVDDRGAPNDRTWTVADEDELLARWVRVRRGWVVVGEGEG